MSASTAFQLNTSTTTIGVFAQGQILCISPNGLQAGHCDAPPPPHPILDDRKWISIAFLAISDKYATFYLFFTKWLPAAILDDRKSLSIAFLAISDQYSTFIFGNFVNKMAAGGHFGWPKISFDRISRHFRSIRNFFLNFFHKMAAGGHFGWPKISFWSHFSPFQMNMQL